MKKLFTVLFMMVMVFALTPITVKAETTDYQVRFEVIDKDPNTEPNLSKEQIPVFVKSLDDGSVYRFPIPLGTSGYVGYFPLPKGRYEFVSEPGAKAGSVTCLSDTEFKVTENEPGNEANCFITTVTETEEISEAATGQAAGEDKKEQPKEKSISIQGKITSIVSIIIVVGIIIFYLYKHFTRGREN